MKRQRAGSFLLALCMVIGLFAAALPVSAAPDAADAAATAETNVYYVSASGSDGAAGTADAPLATIAAAVQKIGDGDGTVLISGSVPFTDVPHEGLITYDAADGTGLLSGGQVSISGPSVINVDFASTMTIHNNGYDLELGGTINKSQYTQLYVGAVGSSHSTIVLKGKFIYAARSAVPGQYGGAVDYVIDGGAIRLITTGTDENDCGPEDYSLGNINITVNSGELWVHNSLDNHPTSTGALQIIHNNGTYKNHVYNDLIASKSFTDWSGGKITFPKGSWSVFSDDTDGNLLATTDEPGTFSVTGSKTAYFQTADKKTAYYSHDGVITLPQGRTDVLWADDFSDALLQTPDPDSTGRPFVKWIDDGNGTITASYDAEPVPGASIEVGLPLYTGTRSITVNVSGGKTDGWIALYRSTESELKNYIDYMDVKADGESEIVFPSNQVVRMRNEAVWPRNGVLADGDYKFILYGDGNYDKILATSETFHVGGTREPISGASYYARFGANGDGRSEENPAGSLGDVVSSINADGFTAGYEVTVYLMDAGEVRDIGATVNDDNFHYLSFNHTVHHDATIRYTTYQFDPEKKNYAVAVNDSVWGYQKNNGIAIQGPTIFESFILLDTRTDYRTDMHAQGYDFTIKDLVRRRIDAGKSNPATSGKIVANAKTDLSTASNRAGRGTVGEGGRVTIYDGSQIARFLFGGYTTANGQDELYQNNHTAVFENTQVAEVYLTGTAENRRVHFEKNVSVVLNDSTMTKIGSAYASRANAPVIDGAVQLILNGDASIGDRSELMTGVKNSAGSPTDLYVLTSPADAGGTLDVTDDTGVFAVNGGKIAYAQSEDLKTVYYGGETLTLPAGEYTVSYAQDLEEVKASAKKPADPDLTTTFDSWVENEDGTLTAKFVKYIPAYYVSTSGDDTLNDGRSPAQPFKTTEKAIDAIEESGVEGLIYCMGAVTLQDKAHTQKITYDSYEGGTLAGPSNIIRLMGPTVFDVEFAATQQIFTNGKELDLGGRVDSEHYHEVVVGNDEGADEKIIIRGKFVYRLLTRIPGQTEGDVDILVDGGVLRQMSTGSLVPDDGSYTVASVRVTVNSGEFWCFNHINGGPHKATGAFELITNGNCFYFDSPRQLLPNVSITSLVDYTPSGTDGFPKIQFEGGKYVIRSADKDGNLLAATGTPGTYRYTGTKTPYYVTLNGQNAYYGKDGIIHLPTGTIDVLWADTFTTDLLSEPKLDEGYEFAGWDDDGNGLVTAVVTNPNFCYVDDTGSDENPGTEERPVQSVSKAIEILSGRSGHVYIVKSAAYDAENIEPYSGLVTITGVGDGAVLRYGDGTGDGMNLSIMGNTKFENLTLEANAADTVLNANGKRLEIGKDVTISSEPMHLSMGAGADADKQIVLPEGTYDVVVGNEKQVSGKTRIVLNGGTADVTVDSGNDAAAVRILSNGGHLASLSTGSSVFGSLEIVSNAGTLEKIEDADGKNVYILRSDAADGSRVDFTDTPGTYGVVAAAGKTPAAFGADGTVYIAEPYSSKDEAPYTWYELNDYADYINYRKPLSNTYKKLTVDKKLDVLYFGGSVTAGYGSSNTELYSWRALIGSWLQEKFPDAEITNTNRAVGESGTYLGTYRVQRDVIAHKPDLLFLEYSINDRYYASGYDNARLQYETIVREVKEALPECDIVTVLVTDSGCLSLNQNGQLHPEAQAHEDMAKIYNIPTLHVGRALADLLKERGESFSNYAIDSVHLNDAGYYEYYLCIREFMYNSLFCTEHTGRLTRYDEPIPVESDALFDGNRQVAQPTPELLAKSESLGGTGFTYSSGLYGAHDYYGIFSASSTDAIFAYEFDGTDLAILSNFYRNSYLQVSIDGGEYQQIEGSSHAPCKVVENIAPGTHIVRFKPSFGSAGSAPKRLDIGAFFTRDRSKATVKGSVYSYDDFTNYTLKVPQGSYEVRYITAEKVSDLPIPAMDNHIFRGWKDARGEAVDPETPITLGMTLIPDYLDANDYFDFIGVQIRVASESQKQGLRFVVEKKTALDDLIEVKNYGMVVIPSLMLGDNRSYTDYAPGKDNSTDAIVGADALYAGSQHSYGEKMYASSEVIAEKIFSETADGVQYTTCITDIPDSAYARYYTLKAFVRYTYQGVDYVAYADPFRSSVYEVSKAIAADEDAGAAEKAVAESVITAVEGE